MLRFSTAGESHGKALLGIIEGFPAGIPISEDYINEQLQRRQKGYGRGGRMKIEKDKIELISGVRGKLSTGAPISFMIKNLDYENWQDIMSSSEIEAGKKEVKRPRPGHADLAGAIKYRHRDMRDILERASARETASRVVVGSIFSAFLKQFNIYIYSQVISIADVISKSYIPDEENLQAFMKEVENSGLRCIDKEAESKMIQAIDLAKESGESLGGVFEIGILGVPPGLGSHVSWDRKLDAQIAASIMSIPAIKAVEIGDGVKNASLPGSEVHDQLYYQADKGIYRKANRAGGIEGGISNGEAIILRAFMKPIPTLYKPLNSVNTAHWQEEKADIERSDICAVPAAAVVGEAMLSYTISRAFLGKFGGDHLEEIQYNYRGYLDYMKKVWR